MPLFLLYWSTLRIVPALSSHSFFLADDHNEHKVVFWCGQFRAVMSKQGSSQDPWGASPSLTHPLCPRQAEVTLGDNLALAQAGQGCWSQDIAHYLNSKSRWNSFAFEQS